MSSLFSRSNRPRGNSRLVMEALEDRQLLSAAPIMPAAWQMEPPRQFSPPAEIHCFCHWHHSGGQTDPGGSDGTDGTTDPPSVEILNSAPLAQDDNFAIGGNQQLGASVLANDSDADGDTLSVSLIAGPEHGSLNIGSDGRFTYAPQQDFDGDDQFTYQVSDGQADSEPATVTIHVTPVAAVNIAPDASDDSYQVLEGETLSVDASGVLANDSDADGNALSATLLSAPEHGTLVLGLDGSFEYTPAAGFQGADAFTYVADDGQAQSLAATVTIDVIQANDAPQAVDDSYAVTQDSVLTMTASEDGVLANDTDANSDPLTSTLVDGPANGTVVLNSDGTFEYTPGAGFVGTDTFTYLANDGQADSNLAIVSITVKAPNSVPAAADDSYAATADQTLTVESGGVLANDVDTDGDPLSAIVVDGPANGDLTLNSDGSFEYTPGAGFVGTDTFTYLANDGQADSNLATVSITVKAPNVVPTASDDSYEVTADQALTVESGGVLANDVDTDGDPLTATVVDGPTNGDLTLNADGSFEYTPGAGFVGTDTFTYLANDGQADSNLAIVTVTVKAANGVPTAVDDSYQVKPNETLAADAAGVLANDSDPDGDPLQARVVEGPQHGSLTLGEDGSFQYVPEADFRGTDTFTYVATDGQVDSDPATVTISVEQTTMRIHLEVSGTPFGAEAGESWSGSTFWVNAYVEDMRDVPQGVVGGAVDIMFESLGLTPTGEVVYGDAFTAYQQGTADDAAGVIDETGALATTAGVGADGLASFVAWEFRRDGEGAPSDANSHVQFSLSPAQGDGTILPSNFALVGQGTPVDWNDVQLDTADIDLMLGDFNADGAVNQFDLALWIPQESTAAGDAAYDPRFDLTADAMVDQADLAVLLPRMYEPLMASASQTSEVADPTLDSLEADLAESLASLQGNDQDQLATELETVDLAFASNDFWKDV